MYTIIDLETTGGKFNEESIIEVAAYKFDGVNINDQFISLINPQRNIHPYVEKLTGISSKMVKSAPKFHEVAKRIIEITSNSILVAHNAQFDYRILQLEFKRLGFDFSMKSICTVILSQELLPDQESYKLGRLSMTINGCRERDKFVLKLAKKNNIPIQISMGGGYSVNIKDILEAHSNTYRLAQEIFF